MEEKDFLFSLFKNDLIHIHIKNKTDNKTLKNIFGYYKTIDVTTGSLTIDYINGGYEIKTEEKENKKEKKKYRVCIGMALSLYTQRRTYMDKISFEDVAKYFGLSVGELRDMCSENSDLLYDLKLKMKENNYE